MIEKFKYADKTTFILFVFISFLILMFLSAYQIKNNISNYSLQSNKITTLQLINKELYNFTFSTNKFINYDAIEKQEELFQQTFQTLQKNLQKYNKHTAPLLQTIANSFEKIVEDLEYFKAQNSSLINSSHFLFDLHTTISNSSKISLSAKNITNETLFYLLRYASNGYIDKKTILKKLNALKKIAKNENSDYLFTFYRHATVMLQTLESLKEVSLEIQKNPLYEQLESLKTHITTNYEHDLEYQTWLTSAFFLITALLLIALIFSHLKSNETKQTLVLATTVFENTEEAIIITDAQGKIISINNAFTNMYDYPLKEIKGKSLNFLHSGKQHKNFYTELWEQIREHGIWKGKLINKTKSGELLPIWMTIKKIVNDNGDVVNYTAVQSDLKEIEDSQEKANYLAYHDPLTGLYNRINFEEYLEHALLSAKRKASMLAILFIDLDRFKTINDTLGHGIGDAVLKVVAQRLKATLRKSDFISRWGGDEFVVILEDLESLSNATTAAEKIIKSLQKPFHVKQHTLMTSASIGIALYPDNGEDSQTLIKHADSAMYLAKESGKNNFQYYTKELSQSIQDRLTIDLALRNALKNNEFFVVFQPQYKLNTNEIHSAEALVRWQNPTLGNIPPDKFIPIAEENNIITPLGYFIFDESCKALQQMQKANVDIKHIAINVSALQFKEINLLENFLNIISKYRLKPSNIEIEITERFVMEHTQKNMHILQNFRDHGFKISIDDFGTGYSSMSYLKHLPADIIKIDKSFVDDIAQGSSDNAIIKAIIALSKTLGYMIVAEGIETKEQERFLAQAKCDFGQGYLFSRPITCKKLIEQFAKA